MRATFVSAVVVLASCRASSVPQKKLEELEARLASATNEIETLKIDLASSNAGGRVLMNRVNELFAEMHLEGVREADLGAERLAHAGHDLKVKYEVRLPSEGSVVPDDPGQLVLPGARPEDVGAISVSMMTDQVSPYR